MARAGPPPTGQSNAGPGSLSGCEGSSHPANPDLAKACHQRRPALNRYVKSKQIKMQYTVVLSVTWWSSSSTCESCGQRPRAKTALGASLHRNLRVEMRAEAAKCYGGRSHSGLGLQTLRPSMVATRRKRPPSFGGSLYQGLEPMLRVGLADIDTVGLTRRVWTVLWGSAFR